MFGKRMSPLRRCGLQTSELVKQGSSDRLTEWMAWPIATYEVPKARSLEKEEQLFDSNLGHLNRTDKQGRL